MIRYAVVWHEANDSGVPVHVMGTSDLFDSEEGARRFIRNAVAEDESRHENSDREELFSDEESNGVRITYGNGQTTYYSIEQISVPEGSKDILEKAEACIDDVNRIAATTIGDIACPAAVRDRILAYYKETNTKLYCVDVRCSPCLCVRVKARSPEEAEEIVNRQIDDRSLFLSQERKDGLVNDILENVEQIDAVHEEDE